MKGLQVFKDALKEGEEEEEDQKKEEGESKVSSQFPWFADSEP